MYKLQNKKYSYVGVDERFVRRTRKRGIKDSLWVEDMTYEYELLKEKSNYSVVLMVVWYGHASARTPSTPRTPSHNNIVYHIQLYSTMRIFYSSFTPYLLEEFSVLWERNEMKYIPCIHSFTHVLVLWVGTVTKNFSYYLWVHFLWVKWLAVHRFRYSGVIIQNREVKGK